MAINKTDNQNRVSKPLLAATTVTGGTIGGYYALTHLPENTLKKLDENKDFPQKYLDSFMKSFDMEKAEEAATNGDLSAESHTKLKNMHNKLTEIFNKQVAYNELAKNPANKGTEESKAALKETNKAMFELKNTIYTLEPNFLKQLKEHNIFNMENFKKTTLMATENAKKVFKIMAKPIGIGITVGVAIGVTVGVGLSTIFGNKKQ